MSETVLALEGKVDPRLGGLGSGAVKPNTLGSFRSDIGGLLENPNARASFECKLSLSHGANGVVCAIALFGVGNASPGWRGGADSGLRDGEPSSLLGGVLNGEIRASNEGLRTSGLRPLLPGMEITLGFVGILGFSARFTGGGLAGDLGWAASPLPFAFPTILTVLERSPLIARGVVGRGDVAPECWEMSSRTFAKGELSIRSGDLEELRSKYVRGGDLGESTLTAGVSWGED